MKGMRLAVDSMLHGMAAVMAAFACCCNAAAQAQAAAGAAELAEVRAKPHPRTISEAQVRDARAEAQQAKWFLARVKAALSSQAPEEPKGFKASSAEEDAKYKGKLRNLIFKEQAIVVDLALAALIGSPEVPLEKAKERALKLARWSPTGATGYRAHDQTGRSVAWALALAYDWLYKEWSEEEKRALLDAIRPRVADMLSADAPYGVDFGRKLDRNPHDSHRVSAMAYLAVICSALAGEDRLFDDCYREIVPRYVRRPIPWGGDDGGFANGTAYAHWATGLHFVVWDFLKNAAGVDLWQAPWARGYVNFMAYFLPPGTPTGMFGDGAEDKLQYVWGAQAKTYAARVPTPLSLWYAHNQPGESRFVARLLSPRGTSGGTPARFPEDAPHAIHLPSIGWVAMHSRLDDRQRASIYFKSSPYGSYNHSHADQNGFVVHARGKPLAIDSGYYDFYGSAHWKSWYTQTRAHNAITFDGGQGQRQGSMKAKGRVTRFEHTARVDVATGDAVEAYDGALNRATRSIVYVRPGTALVVDSVASSKPRTWEWNIHALHEMKVAGERSIEIDYDDARLCVRMLDGREVAFAQTNEFTASPVPSKKRPNQWHGTFSARTPSTEAYFVFLLDIGCQGTPVQYRKSGREAVVTVAGRGITVDEHANVVRVQ